MNKPRFLLFDSCVVIDFFDVDHTLFRLVSEFLGQVCIARPLLEEIKGRVSVENATSLGVEIVDVVEEDVLAVLEREATTKKNDPWGRLSDYDVLCLLTAQRNKYVCVSNDLLLLKRCNLKDVKTKRGLRLVVELLERRALTKERAREIGKSICDVNKWSSVYKEFIRLVDDIQ